jgi:hypothetical protein
MPASGAAQSAALRWLGQMSLSVAMVVVAVATVVGVILTLIAGQEPGVLLGVFVILGSLVAALGVRRSFVYLLFPLPTLALFLGALMAGVVHDSNLTSSTAGLGVGFTQWIAGIFFPMVVATILVLLVGGGRWVFSSQLVTGISSMTASAPGSTRPAPPSRPRRPASGGQWAAEDPFSSGNPDRTGPAPRPGGASGPGARGPRPPRDQRTDRDPWGDPRLSDDRSQPRTGPRPGPRPGPRSQPSPGPRPRPGDPAGPASQPQPQSQPRDRTGPRPQQGPRTGPSWDPAARPQRRPQPPEDWTSRLARPAAPARAHPPRASELLDGGVAQYEVLDPVRPAEVDLRLGPVTEPVGGYHRAEPELVVVDPVAGRQGGD